MISLRLNNIWILVVISIIIIASQYQYFAYFRSFERIRFKIQVIFDDQSIQLEKEEGKPYVQNTHDIIDGHQYIDTRKSVRDNDKENEIYKPSINYNKEEKDLRINDPDFPTWMQEYLSWHVEMRERFPGDELMTHPDAPNLLVRLCFIHCGGLNDRLGQLSWDVYLAARTKRILLIYWARPTPLEDYLVPNTINFTYPDTTWYPSNGTNRVPYKDRPRIENVTDIFRNYSAHAPEDQFFTAHFDEAVDRAINQDKNEKVLKFRLLGHIGENYLKQHTQKYFRSNKDESEAPVFGKLFHLFFKPSPQMHDSLKKVQNQLNLIPGQFSAVHCRVTHPKAIAPNLHLEAKIPKFGADFSGLKWKDNEKGRNYALSETLKALQCIDEHEEQIYFFSDSSDLVGFVGGNKKYQPKSEAEHQFRQIFDQYSIATRDTKHANRHMDKNINRDNPSVYFGTFIDLYLAVQARCVVYGVGRYALFAAKISGTKCRRRYRKESWGIIGEIDEISQKCKSNFTVSANPYY